MPKTKITAAIRMMQEPAIAAIAVVRDMLEGGCATASDASVDTVHPDLSQVNGGIVESGSGLSSAGASRVRNSEPKS
jgi:hypothetical protein